MRTVLYFFACLLSLLTSCTNVQESDGIHKAGNKENSQAAKNNVITGKVIAVSDGDTFRLLTEENETVRVRLHGVDAPEKKQDFGTQSRQMLGDLIFGKRIEVERRNKDRYGRIIGVAYADGININEEMLRRGMVWHYTEYDKTDRWSTLEAAAKRNKKGLWLQSNPLPPWQWRKQQRTGGTATD